jgi:hypothetical protein
MLTSHFSQVTIHFWLRLRVGFRFGKTDNLGAFLPLTALLEQLDPLKSFQHVALRRDRAGAF